MQPLQRRMSVPNGVIALKPIKGAELMRQASPTEPIPAGSRYLPPSKRGDEVKQQKPLTVEQLDSQMSFPSLPTVAHMTKAASWGKLRARLSSPPATPKADADSSQLLGDTQGDSVESPKAQEEHSMKNAIEQSLKRNQAAEVDAQHREAITDPFLMTKEKCAREGWEVLRVNLKGDERRQWFEKSTYNVREHVEQPYAWPAPIMSFSLDKVQKLIQPLQ